MTCLVTGGAGFIGSHLVDALLARGERVVVVDDFSNGRPENVAHLAENPNFSLVRGNVCAAEVRDEVWRRGPFSAVYHLAAEINVQKSLDDPAETFDRDVVGTFHLLERIRTAPCRFVFMSTCMVYDRCDDRGGIGEGSPVKPASPYAAAKLAGEALTLSYHFGYGLPTVVMRPFNTYGPRQKTGGEGGVVAIFVRNALEEKPLAIYGDGTQTRDLLFVEDCVEFILCAGECPEALGQIWNAGTGRDVSINDLAALVSREVGRGTAEIRHVPHHHPQSEIAVLRCDAEKARNLLGWTPRTPLEEGLRRVAAWMRNAGELPAGLQGKS